MRERIQKLIELYELRLKAGNGLTGIYGPEVTKGILIELEFVIQDLKTALEETKESP